MQLLLDTHIWIWAVQPPEKLGHAVRRQLENPENELFLSPVSIWEACHLVRRKRLLIKQGFSGWLEMVFARVPLQEAPFNFAVAAQVAGIELPESDAGDVFLAATAAVFRLTLVTADPRFAGRAWLKTLAND